MNLGNPILAGLPMTVFDEMSGLAREHRAINLGQGFPDDPGPPHVLARAAEALLTGSNQYPPMRGLPELRQAVARHYAARQHLDLDWETEVTVTSGATEALACAILALVQAGDEVVMVQPLYDAYAPMVRLAGGVPRFVTARPPAWRIERADLEAAFTPRTRVLIMNNPVNPTGRVLDADELALLAEFCVRFVTIALCDEVWEQVVFDGRSHTPLMALPGMRGRSVKVGSAGKMFGLTGWKVGWLCAAPPLTAVLARAHQFLTFTTPPNLQAACAFGLDNPQGWFDAMPVGYARSRDRLTAALAAQGYAVLPSAGTYFLSVDLAASGVNIPDRDFCLRAVRQAGVAAIPVSAFYEEAPQTSIVRLCFAKADATLDEAARRLGTMLR
ncbi:MAG: aminotransferase, class [Caulobacteraceae bacterium]|nr:aminotransferase, class [Caulobacteraceae bacterium]